MLAFLFAPLAVIALVSVSAGTYLTFPPRGLTLAWYGRMLAADGFLQSLWLSARLGAAVALVSLALGTTAALGLASHGLRGRKLLTALVLSPLVVPSQVTGIALLQFFRSWDVNSPFWMLLLGHAVIAALDKALRQRMQVELRALQRQVGITTLFVTHDQDEALTMADRIAVMSRGRIEQVDTPAAMYESPRSAFVLGFLGQVNSFAATVIWAGPAGIRVRSAGGLEVVSAHPAGLREGALVVGIRPERGCSCTAIPRNGSTSTPPSR